MLVENEGLESQVLITEAGSAVLELSSMELAVSLYDSLDSQMERETRTIIAMSQSTDGRQGVQASAQKRKPEFTGQ